MTSKRVIIDTNLWISFLISSNYSDLDRLLKSGRVRLIFSDELIEEFLLVAGRPKLKKFFHQKGLTTLLDLFDDYAELVEVKSDIQLCRDVKDNFLLNLAVDGGVDFLITGDKDLLILGHVEKIPIITYNQFIDLTQ